MWTIIIHTLIGIWDHPQHQHRPVSDIDITHTDQCLILLPTQTSVWYYLPTQTSVWYYLPTQAGVGRVASQNVALSVQSLHANSVLDEKSVLQSIAENRNILCSISEFAEMGLLNWNIRTGLQNKGKTNIYFFIDFKYFILFLTFHHIVHSIISPITCLTGDGYFIYGFTRCSLEC